MPHIRLWPRVAIALVGLLGFGHAPAVLVAGVVVVNNRSDRTVQFTLGPRWKGDSTYSLAPARLIPVQVPGGVYVTFKNGSTTIRRRLESDTLNEFYSLAGHVNIRPVPFGVAPPRVIHTDEPPGPVTVLVKLLAEEGNRGTRAMWESRLREQLDIASRYLEMYCGVRFRVAAVGTWRAKASKKKFSRLVNDFAKVDPRPASLAIGLVSGVEGDLNRGIHDARRPLFTHLLLPDTQKGFTRNDQLEVLVHALGHYLGAVHCTEQGSAMRAGRLRGRTRVGSLVRPHEYSGDEPLRRRDPYTRLAALWRPCPATPASTWLQSTERWPRDCRQIVRFRALLNWSTSRLCRMPATWADGSTVPG